MDLHYGQLAADGFNKTSASSRFAPLLLHLFSARLRSKVRQGNRRKDRRENPMSRNAVAGRSSRAICPVEIVRCRYSSESNARTALCLGIPGNFAPQSRPLAV